MHKDVSAGGLRDEVNSCLEVQVEVLIWRVVNVKLKVFELFRELGVSICCGYYHSVYLLASKIFQVNR